MTVLGATGIEDCLQEGVPRAIRQLRAAGIRIWLLTGDKLDTAISVGQASQLLSDRMRKIIIADTTQAACGAALRAARTQLCASYDDGAHEAGAHEPAPCWWSSGGCDACGARGSADHDGGSVRLLRATPLAADAESAPPMPSGVALVLDGPALEQVLGTQLEGDFIAVARACETVLCCRTSPMQKALVLQALRRHAPRCMTLAIGDGANDVAMIQTANVGVGVSAGQEGHQAVRGAAGCAWPLVGRSAEPPVVRPGPARLARRPWRRTLRWRSSASSCRCCWCTATGATIVWLAWSCTSSTRRARGTRATPANGRPRWLTRRGTECGLCAASLLVPAVLRLFAANHDRSGGRRARAARSCAPVTNVGPPAGATLVESDLLQHALHLDTAHCLWLPRSGLSGVDAAGAAGVLRARSHESAVPWITVRPRPGRRHARAPTTDPVGAAAGGWSARRGAGSGPRCSTRRGSRWRTASCRWPCIAAQCLPVRCVPPPWLA